MSKELFRSAHDELVEEYMNQHPDATWKEAYEITAYKAHDRMLDRALGIVNADKLSTVK